MQSSGYTPLSAFRKPNLSQNSAIDDKINPKTPIVATTDQEGISGEFQKLLKLDLILIVHSFNRLCYSQAALRFWTSAAVNRHSRNYG